MDGQDSLDALTCPNCGAPLEFAGGQSTTQCIFCGAHIERTNRSRPTPEPEMPTYRETPSYGETPQVVVMTSPPQQRGCRSCLPAMTITLIIALPILIGLLSVTQAGHVFKALISGDVPAALTAIPLIGENLNIGESAILAPTSDGMPPDIIVLATHYPLNNDQYEDRLIALKSDSPTLRWQSESLGKATYRVPILADADRVYTLHETELIALNRSNGSLAWETVLPDVVSPNTCQNCVQLWENIVFTLSDDGTLLATDAQTSKELWNYRGIEDSPRGLYHLGGRVAFLDDDENNDGLLRFFDPQTGEMETLQPVCNVGHGPNYADWTTPLYPSPDGNSFYIILSFADTCAQRWDANKNEQLWSVSIPGPVHDPAVLITPQTVYIGEDNLIVSMDAKTGDMRTLIEEEDYTFVPLEATQDSLLVRATRQRGSKRFEIRSVNSADGSTNWTFNLDNNPPMDPPDEAHSIIDDDAPVWTWHMLSDNKLLILRFKRAVDDKSHALLWDVVDMQTGQSDGTQERKLRISTIILSAPDFRIWQRNVLWMSIEGKLLAFDAEAGEIIYRWP